MKNHHWYLYDHLIRKRNFTLTYKLQNRALKNELTYLQANFEYANHFALIACFKCDEKWDVQSLKVSILRPNYLNDLSQLARHHHAYTIRNEESAKFCTIMSTLIL